MTDLISIEEVCDLTRVSKPTIYRHLKAGNFPTPVKVPTNRSRGPKKINRWERADIEAWCAQKQGETLENAARTAMAADHGTEASWYERNKFLAQAAIAGFLGAMLVWWLR